MIAALVAGLVAGWAIALPVGAIAAYLVGLTARTSFRVGAAAALGAATADGIYALAAILGGSALVRVIGGAVPPLRLIAAVLLVGVALVGLTRAVRGFRRISDERGAIASADAVPRPARAYLRLVALTLVNPATIVYFAALVVGGRGVGTASLPDCTLFAGAAFAASASWQLTVAGAGAVIGRLLTGPRGRLCTAALSSSIIVVLAVRLVLAA